MIPSHAPRRRANLFIVGAPKCGTTAWAEYLRSHPDIFFPIAKDDCFFALDLPKFRFVHSEAEYLDLFSGSGGARYIGEASAMYLFSTAAASAIRDYNAEAKVIIFLREQEGYLPALHNQFLLEFAEEIEDFETVWRLSGRRPPETIPVTCLEPRTLDYAAMGRFREQVERYLSNFPPEQVLVIRFRDWVADPRTTYLGILDFLGLEDDGRTDFPPINQGQSYRSRGLARFIRYPPGPVRRVALLAKKLTGPLGRSLERSARKASLKSVPGYRNEISPELRDEIRHYYAEDNRLLEVSLDALNGSKSDNAGMASTLPKAALSAGNHDKAADSQMVIARTPRVSVVMPVYNALPYLDAAIESILRQTFEDFEFVILDDASTDGSTERLRQWASRDTRIRLVEAKQNLGPARSSERVARAASAPIVARMDADDISYPQRLADQLEVLDCHSDVGVVGGLFDIIDAKSHIVRGPEHWRLHQPASVPPFGNGPLTYRSEVFDRVGGYREACEYWEDNDLILRMALVTKIMVLPYSVYQVRLAKVSTRLSSHQPRVERAIDLMYRARARLERGLSYDDLLQSPLNDDRKVNPQVFVSLGSIVLWAGGRPRLFKRLLSRSALGFDRRTLTALVWTAWGAAEPHSLRAFIRLLLLRRKLRTSGMARIGGPILWPIAPNSEPSPPVP